MGTGRLVAVGAVFLASLAALVASTGLVLWGSADELSVRDELRAAASELAAAAGDATTTLPPDQPGAVLPEPENRRLAAVVARVLAGYPGAEGGFYLAASDQFAGTMTAGPTAEPPEKDAAKKGKKDKNKGEKASPGLAAGRRDPPPLETESIRQQAREVLTLEPGTGPLVEVRDIRASRVAIATAPVGDDRPACVAVWVMIRLTGPEQQKALLGRLRVAFWLSLTGVLLALGLAAVLVRSLLHEEKQRAALGEELRKAEHLAALGRLLAGVAHEVRNPLTAIRSTVQLWERLPTQARTPESLAAVVAAVDRINELVGRLLLFARAGHEVRRAVDLNAVVTETLELVRARADGQGAKLEADLIPGLSPATAADQAVRQVVLNLVTNALQVMPAGGRLVCRTRALPGDRVELAVSDTGPGVPADLRDRVFEPFFTTRPDGTGLGLALCREVARQHGGDVTLDPGSGPGATFRLTLPASPGEPHDDPAFTRGHRAGRGRRPRHPWQYRPAPPLGGVHGPRGGRR
jgi:signal transduction histidine kinase